jgi:hypothetical protein
VCVLRTIIKDTALSFIKYLGGLGSFYPDTEYFLIKPQRSFLPRSFPDQVCVVERRSSTVSFLRSERRDSNLTDSVQVSHPPPQEWRWVRSTFSNPEHEPSSWLVRPRSLSFSRSAGIRILQIRYRFRMLFDWNRTTYAQSFRIPIKAHK